MSRIYYQKSTIPNLLARFDSNSLSICNLPISTLSITRKATATTTIKKEFPTYHFNPNKSIEIWNASCIVTNFGKNQSETRCKVLINPANVTLSGARNFPYFPRGGPVPQTQQHQQQSPYAQFYKDWQPLGYVSNWGGMEIGSAMMFPENVIDGIVHRLGQKKLLHECQTYLKQYENKNGTPFSFGMAMSTCTGHEDLLRCYDFVVHTTPPFYIPSHNMNHDPLTPTHTMRQSIQSFFSRFWKEKESQSKPALWNEHSVLHLLQQCYVTALFEAEACIHRYHQQQREKQEQNQYSYGLSWIKLARNRLAARKSHDHTHNTQKNYETASSHWRIACPLIGAGARGFPLDIALDIASKQALLWMSTNEEPSHMNSKLRKNNDTYTLAFGIPDPSIAESLIRRIKDFSTEE